MGHNKEVPRRRTCRMLQRLDAIHAGLLEWLVPSKKVSDHIGDEVRMIETVGKQSKAITAVLLLPKMSPLAQTVVHAATDSNKQC